ncbi:hypothetical protein [Serratia sp. M24T3]|uniref:tail fiber/spike domain-containing protein n=1 Tax=Serratia sp. M24T3 TaxID=932213 RepID=UPI00025B9F61|nr:hypothetical protein [Serratia sp. M24T3]EIC83957.1 putative prophage endo-N-neuraminidase [Serratia sp. M24T3]
MASNDVINAQRYASEAKVAAATAKVYSDQNTTIVTDAQEYADQASTYADNSSASASLAEQYYSYSTGLSSWFIGTQSTAPITRNDGSALQVGDMYKNSSDDEVYSYNSDGTWTNISYDAASAKEYYEYNVGNYEYIAELTAQNYSFSNALSSDSGAALVGAYNGLSVQDNLTNTVKGGNTFVDGATLDSVLDQINDGTNLYYWTGDFPKVVPANSSVDATGGIESGAWSVSGDGLLRTALASAESGAALVATQQGLTGTVARTQDNKNAESISLMDGGSERSDFDPSVEETAIKLLAKSERIPYLGAKQYCIPGSTLKTFNWIDGYKDRGAAVSFSNLTTPDHVEPTTQVLGLADASGLGSYSDRDQVLLFTQIQGAPALLTTSDTTFTANTITSSDIASVSEHLRAGQIIDVTDSSDSTVVYSGLITSLSDSTITVDTAWYLKGGDGTTGTPSESSTAVFVPSTKIWGQNTVVTLASTSKATQFAGYELGLINDKTDGYVGYGFDVVNLGDYGVGQAFQSRGEFNIGFVAYDGTNYGFVSYSANTAGYYSAADTVGALLQNNTYGVQIKGASSYPLLIQDAAGSSTLTAINSSGQIEYLRLRLNSSVTIGGTISSYNVVNFVRPTTDSDTVYLPTANAGLIIKVRNVASTYSVTLVGSYEGTSGVKLQPGNTIELIGDGSTWYTIGHQGPINIRPNVTISVGGTLVPTTSINFVTSTASTDTVTVPTGTTTGQSFIVRNLSSSYSLILSGSVEGATSLTLDAGSSIELYYNGTYWYPISGYSPNVVSSS